METTFLLKLKKAFDAIELKYEGIFTLENGETKMTDKKLYENEDLAIRLALELEDLKKTVEQMNEKRGGIFLDWMKIQTFEMTRTYPNFRFSNSHLLER